MTKEKLDLIEKLIEIHGKGVESEGGGPSSDAWYGGSLRMNGDQTYWSPSMPQQRYGDIEAPPLPELLSDLIAFARSKL